MHLVLIATSKVAFCHNQGNKKEQGAFRRRRSCTDQLFTVRMLSEKTIAKNKRIINGMHGIRKILDDANRELMWSML